MDCRICGAGTRLLLDLGSMPPANWLVERADSQEQLFPLSLKVCETCSNLQLPVCLGADILYSHYFYVTPDSRMLERHYDWLIEFLFDKGYVDRGSSILEIGSNRGAFLKRLMPLVSSALGVDPAQNVVEMAMEGGIPTVCDFFDAASASRIESEFGKKSVIVARHCLAHNEWPQRMLQGVDALLSSDGIFVIENNYAGKMIEDVEFDQIYHEHMFYYSLSSLDAMLRRNGLRVIDVDLRDIHGGSIVCVAAREGSSWETATAVDAFARREEVLLNAASLETFVRRVNELRWHLRSTIDSIRARGKTISAYGATAKAATLLNACKLTARDIPFCADSTAIKQGRFIPGTGIAIVAEQELLKTPPDYFLLTAWNYKDELIDKVRAAGGSEVGFIVPFPEVAVIE